MKYLQVALVVTVLLSVVVGTSKPANADLAGDIDRLKEEQEKVKKRKEDQSKSIDAATAEAEELAAALQVLNEQVNAQQEQIDAAEREREQTSQRGANAEQEAVELEKRRQVLEEELAALAIRSFQAQGKMSDSIFFGGDDPGEFIKMNRLAKTVTRSEAEAAEELRQTEADLEALILEGENADVVLETQKQELETQKAKLEEVRNAQLELSTAAEERLEAALAEAAVLEERDKELAQTIREKNSPVARQNKIAQRNQSKPAAAPPPPGGPKTGKIVGITNYAGQRIEVDSSIAARVQAMYDASAAAGLKLGGWGYRDGNRQIQLRIKNCGGSSNYIIYQKPSSSCRPPTARPGQSNHESGLAIDITSGGSTIRSRNSAAFRWLKANAASYGLKNLPSEPWHWSVNGK